ncbi:MAG: hypothetical protein PVG06_08805 [Desulfobacterales bacterium]|jgi:hypothetical protein
MSEKYKELILTIPEHLYQRIENLASENKKTIYEMSVEMLVDQLKQEEATREYREQIVDYLEDRGGEKSESQKARKKKSYLRD